MKNFLQVLSEIEYVDYSIWLGQNTDMEKQELILIIQKILRTDYDLSFLGRIRESELENLAACIRDKVEKRV